MFGERVVAFAKRIPVTPVTRDIISQFVDAGTAIGANYCEADVAESRRDFEHKMGISRKEAKETMYWLRIIAKAVPELVIDARTVWVEANELLLIFSSIIHKSRSKHS